MRDQFREAIERTLDDGFASIPISEGTRPLLERALKQRIGGITATELSIKLQDEAKPNTLSAKYGAGEFPHHTDFAFRPQPPRLIALINSTDQAYERSTVVARFADLPENMLVLHAKT